MFIDFSISEIKQKMLLSTRRFPWVILVSSLCTALSCILIYEPSFFDKYNNNILKFLAVLYLGIPLSVGLSLLKESIIDSINKYAVRGFFKKINNFNLDILILLITCLLITYVSIPGFNNSIFGIKYFQIILVAHLFVSLAPFLNITRIENLDFWSYNYFLLQRFLKSGIYALTFWVGLSLALLTINLLFDLKLTKAFGYLGIFTTVLFQTWFFVAGIPENFKKLNTNFIYPNELRIFTQFVLFPITSVYLIILYVYTFKILVQWNIPSGYISWLISSISVLGAFTLILVHPLRHNKDFKWVDLFWRAYFFLILPLLGLLFFALFLRIFEYGLTEGRILLFVCGLTLLGLSLYFSFSKNENIKWIPFSLMFFGLITFTGPFNATKISFNSQMKMIQGFIKKYDLINLANLDKITPKDARSLTSIIYYLESRNKDKVDQFLVKNFSWINIDNAVKSEFLSDQIEAKLLSSLHTISSKEPSNANLYIALKSMGIEPFSFKNAVKFLPVNLTNYGHIKSVIRLNGVDWGLDLVSDRFVISKKNTDDFFDVSFNPLFELALDLNKNGKGSELTNIPKEHALYSIEYKDIKGSFFLNEITFQITEGKKVILSLGGILLLE